MLALLEAPALALPEEDLVFVFGGTADASSYPPLPWMVFGGEELWGYDVDTDAWTLHRATPNPGYRVSAWAGFDPQGGQAILVGGDGYDAERRFTGPVTTPWVHRDLPGP